MKYINRDLKQEEINLKSYKIKYFFIGFLVGIIPYIIMTLICDYSYVASNLFHFKKILITIGIATALINGFILQGKINRKYLTLMQINKGAKINS